ncbi:zinc finger protein [Macleaya cordata]|uniref:Zinc finger protein n=1 Tax=Macleaya cordata TaxID=56857 RepID=A0A200R8R4_MACCD|nr:zinc finger protein [Macleaya cordata]
MVVNGRPLKRMKRRITADLKDFLTFPASSDDFSGHFDGPLRSNIRTFLTKHAQLSPPAAIFPHLLIWQIVFRIGDLIDGPDSSPAVVTLDIVEEDVTRSRSVYCDQCRVVGWSGHPVCGKRYHFIIRAGSSNSSSIDGYNKPCSNCGDLLHMPDSRCKSCNYVITADDLEQWVYLQLENTTHLLHGVVHSNGYGHLLRVNGREGGSKFLSGCDIMNFWDRLCRTIRVRKISVMDVSKKYGLEYRLLHAITNGHPWYGDWGYEFGAGSFALTLDAYKKAVDNLSEIPLSLFFTEREPRTRLQNVISFYQSLSEFELLTMSDLFRFLMRLIRNSNDPSSPVNTCKRPGSGSWALCSWTKDDIERVEQAMIKVLRAVGGDRWVSWRSLKGALYRMASSELLDHCLKDLGGKLVTDGMVYSRCNPDTDALEYRLKLDNVVMDEMSGGCSTTDCPTKEHLLRDLKFLYNSLLYHQTMILYRPKSTRENAKSSAKKLLDCKQFVKDYKPEKITMPNPFAVRVLCEVELIDHPKDYTAPPPELIILPSNATVSDIKTEATKAFQEVYILFRRFQVEEVLDLNLAGVSTVDCIKSLDGSSSLIRVRGRCLGKQVLHRFRMERGTENWTVKCICGAKDDDGERMLACDVCGVWQHTRCSGIEDFNAVPETFMCGKCGGSGGPSSRPKEEMKGDLPRSSIRCKDESVAVEDTCRTGNNLTVAFGVR